MPKLDAIFEEKYIYGTGQGNLGHGLNVYLIDIFGRYTIAPIYGSSGFHYVVDTLYTYSYESGHLVFKSKKKAMQYVVAQLFTELFTELFDYEQYRTT